MLVSDKLVGNRQSYYSNKPAYLRM